MEVSIGLPSNSMVSRGRGLNWMKAFNTPALSFARDTHVSRKSHLWAGGTVGV